MKNLLEDEAVVVGGSNHSHATQDLYDSIAAGNYPEWKLLIQVLDPSQLQFNEQVAGGCLLAGLLLAARRSWHKRKPCSGIRQQNIDD